MEFDGSNPSPPYLSISFNSNYNANRLSHLTILQSIYASNNGIVNVDGDTVTPAQLQVSRLAQPLNRLQHTAIGIP